MEKQIDKYEAFCGLDCESAKRGSQRSTTMTLWERKWRWNEAN